MNQELSESPRDNPEPAEGQGRSYGLAVAGLMVVFILALAPLLGGVSKYFGDERFYTEAAIRMVQSGDYFTPHEFSGAVRFNKPILAYWVVAASYQLLGIGLVASRLPFLLAGSLMIGLTYQTARALFRSRDAAFLAALMMFSNVQMLSSATRSTPDIYLCLFLNLSLLGFANVIFNRQPTALNFGLAYVGAALAVITKGMSGVFPIVLAFLFCLVRKGPGVKARDLIHWPSILLAVVVAVFWFAVVIYRHGMAVFDGFFYDQVGENLPGAQAQIPKNLVAYLIAVVRHFVPWSVLLLIALPRDWRALRGVLRETKEKCLFVLGWYLLLYVVFAMGNTERSRYLLPAYPLLAALFAVGLLKIVNEGRSALLLQRVSQWVVYAGAAAAGLLAVAGAFMTSPVFLGGLLALLVTLPLCWVVHRGNCMSRMLALGVIPLLWFHVVLVLVQPVFVVAPAPALTERLLALHQEGTVIMAAGLPQNAVHQIRVLSGGRLEGKNLITENTLRKLHTNLSAQLGNPALAGIPGGNLSQYPVVLLPETDTNLLAAADYRFEAGGYSYNDWTLRDVLELMKTPDKRSVFERLKIRYVIALRRQTGDPS